MQNNKYYGQQILVVNSKNVSRVKLKYKAKLSYFFETALALGIFFNILIISKFLIK